MPASAEFDTTVEATGNNTGIVIPDDFASALSAEPGLGAFFAGLSNSLQRYHVDSINDAKTPETRTKRIDKAISLFREGKKR
ncbi:YdeI/OmpD-associated family protein [Gryllotalpicola protaetiae]|nr:YdeI/OmpD-associated family protein [Gryllotalpicola protaetiae]